MSDAQELWRRHRDGPPLAAQESAALAEALRRDPALREACAADLAIADLLAARTPDDGEVFVADLLDRLELERDRSAFARRVQARIAGRGRRRPLLRPPVVALGAALAAALVVAVATGWPTAAEPAPDVDPPAVALLERDGIRTPLAEGHELTAIGDERIRFPDGSQLRPEPGTKLVVGRPAQAAATVRSGAVLAEVAAQRDGAAFVVRGGGASATVLGTRFRFAVDADGARCAVEEGRVRFVGEGSAPRVLAAGEDASLTADPLVRQRLALGAVTLFRFAEGGGPEVRDDAGGPALRADDGSALRWGPAGLTLAAPTVLRTAVPPTALNRAIAGGRGISIEALLTPREPPPFATRRFGPARILTLSTGIELRNLTLGQGEADWDGQGFSLRVRREAHPAQPRSANGLPSSQVEAMPAPGRPLHLVAACHGTGVRWWIDGQPAEGRMATPHQREAPVATGPGGWDPAAVLALGGEVASEDDAGRMRPWLGTYHLIAVYDRAVDDAAAQALHASALSRLGAMAPDPR